MPLTMLDQDTYIRPNQSGLGTGSSGSTYDTSNASTYTFSIVSNHAEVTTGTAQSTVQYGSKAQADGEVWYQFQASNITGTWGAVARYVSSTSYILCRYNNGNISIYHNIAGTFTSLATAAFTITANTWYQVRFIYGSTRVSMKIWAATDVEANATTIVGATTVTQSGTCGLYLNAGTGTFIGRYANFTIYDASNRLYEFDNFTRANNASSWGTTPAGTTWTRDTAGSSFVVAIASNTATIAATAATGSQYMYLNETFGTNTVGQVDVINGNATMSMGLLFRYVVGAANFYRLLLSGSGVLQWQKLVSSTSTLLGGSYTQPEFSVGTKYTMKAQVVLGVLSGKVWRSDLPEPPGWQLVVSDTSLTAAGLTCLSISNNVATAGTATFDNYSVSAASLNQKFGMGRMYVTDWYPGTWGYRKRIRVNQGQLWWQTTGDFTNFPLVLQVTDVNLKSVPNGGHMANASAFDLMFTDGTGTLKLNHEIERYDPTNGNLSVWVNVPTISQQHDTYIYAYYGNPNVTVTQENRTAVWDSHYMAVWHFGQWLGPTIDSTSHNNTLTAGTGITTVGNNFIGTAAHFAGTATTDGYTIADNSSLDPTGGLTIEGWMNPDSLSSTDNRTVLAKHDGTNVQYWIIFYPHAADQFSGSARAQSAEQRVSTPTTNTPASTWTHFVFIANSNGNTYLRTNGIYRGGTPFTAAALQTLVATLKIGGKPGSALTTDLFKGFVEEIRISDFQRDDNSLFNNYLAMINNTTYVTWSAVEQTRTTRSGVGRTIVAILTTKNPVGRLIFFPQTTRNALGRVKVIGQATRNGLGRLYVVSRTLRNGLGRAFIWGRYAALKRSQSPLAYFRMNNTSGSITDSSGNSNTGTVVGGTPTYGVAGLLKGDIDTAIQWSAQGAFTLPTALNMNGSSAFSIECLIKPSSSPPGSGLFWNILGGPGSSAAHTGYLLYVAGTVGLPSIAFMVANGTIAPLAQIANFPLVSGQTYHLVGTYDGTNARLYINGRLVGTSTTVAGPVSNSGSPIINANTTSFFPGVIDEVSYAATVYSSTDVSALYEAAIGKTRNATGRTRVGIQALRNGLGRLLYKGQTTRNAIGRLRYFPQITRNGVGRLLYKGRTTFNAIGRTNVGIVALKNGLGRVRVSLGTVRNGLGRVRLGVIATKNGLGRLRYKGQATRNGLGRVRFVMRDTINALGRVKFVYQTTRNSVGRVRVGIIARTNQMGRLNVRGRTTANATGRTRIGLVVKRNGLGRLKYVYLTIKNTSGRLILALRVTRNGLGRVRVVGQHTTNAIGRLRFGTTATLVTRNALARLWIVSRITKNATGRIKFYVLHTYNGMGRTKIVAQIAKNARGRLLYVARQTRRSLGRIYIVSATSTITRNALGRVRYGVKATRNAFGRLYYVVRVQRNALGRLNYKGRTTRNTIGRLQFGMVASTVTKNAIGRWRFGTVITTVHDRAIGRLKFFPQVVRNAKGRLIYRGQTIRQALGRLKFQISLGSTHNALGRLKVVQLVLSTRNALGRVRFAIRITKRSSGRLNFKGMTTRNARGILHFFPQIRRNTIGRLKFFPQIVRNARGRLIYYGQTRRNALGRLVYKGLTKRNVNGRLIYALRRQRNALGRLVYRGRTVRNARGIFRYKGLSTYQGIGRIRFKGLTKKRTTGRLWYAQRKQRNVVGRLKFFPQKTRIATGRVNIIVGMVDVVFVVPENTIEMELPDNTEIFEITENTEQFVLPDNTVEFELPETPTEYPIGGKE